MMMMMVIIIIYLFICMLIQQTKANYKISTSEEAKQNKLIHTNKHKTNKYVSYIYIYINTEFNS
jgi:hypothetical protein